MIVLAPTGIAAINAGGMTIHSFFQLPIGPFVPTVGYPEGKRRYDRFNRNKLRLIKTIDLIVIDEISMVRADLLDAVDSVLRRHRDPRQPFGGVQLLMIGDLQQLAPVVKPDEWKLLKDHYATPYFFDSQALKSICYETIELSKVYRQNDPRFLELLGKIRKGNADTATISTLNTRYLPNFKPSQDLDYIRLTTHNRHANDINAKALAALPGAEYRYHASVEGEFPDMSYPTDPQLSLKIGAQVMFLRNDNEKGFYNGMMGRVVALRDHTVTVKPYDPNHQEIIVEPSVWENTKYTLDPKTGEIKEEIQGRFSQMPLRLSWAITIHKSQGLTFDRAIIDASASFAHGQIYVALSRCRTLEGIILEKPLSHSAIITDRSVEDYSTSHPGAAPDRQRLQQMQQSYIIECLDQIFGTTGLRMAFDTLHRIVSEYLSRDYPLLSSRYDDESARLRKDVDNVAISFAHQYRTLKSDQINDRVSKGCAYFTEKFAPLIQLLKETPAATDNKAVSQRLETALSDIGDILFLKREIMSAFESEPFSPGKYLEIKNRATLKLESGKTPETNGVKKRKSKTTSLPSDITNPRLYEALIEWRRAEMDERQVPAYIIASNRSLMWIAANRPLTIKELSEAPGIGKAKLKDFGESLLSIVHDYAHD